MVELPFLYLSLDRYLPTWRGNAIDAQMEINQSRILGFSIYICERRRWDPWCLIWTR
ncbi:hypothetical protein NC653_008518 [Populus alba x Populus x berolinensis]|uniref:Uncharacterized protein n=1 Tax=Populus alba x Populus x berolinensis TaxID=444605 RepID=A0AAD6W944_9ROSI|nr:hypothetical protein NC653_008518 [Populus alba x Populus x berolinensis]